MASEHILLVEDDLTLGELLMSVFGRTGHGVTWFVRARLTEQGLVLMDADGIEVLLKPARYELALVDYRLKGSPIDGPEVTSYLVAAGLPVVGMSGMPDFNKALMEAGARGGIVKGDLFSRVLNRTLVIDRDFTGDR